MTAKTAQWARVLEAAHVEAMPASYSGFPREWLLGTLIAKVESAVLFRNIGMDDKADQMLAEAMVAISASKEAPAEQGARVEGIRGGNAARQWAGGYR